VEAEDVDYLLGVVNQAMPAARLERQDVAYSFAGLRVLPHDGGQKPSAVAREEVISESVSGLISAGGGKLTSHRGIGEQIGTKVLARLGRQVGPRPTRTQPLPGARGIPKGIAEEKTWKGRYPWLAGRYGSRAAIVAKIAGERPDLAVPIATDAPAIGAEVVFAIHHEWARTVSDFLLRRTAMAWRNPPAAIASAMAVGRIMAAELGWDAAKTDGQVAAFREHMRRATMAVQSAEVADGESANA